MLWKRTACIGLLTGHPGPTGSQLDRTLPILFWEERQADDIHNLVEVVQPTALCQLGCHYCGQEHVSRKLSPENQRLLVKHITDKLEGGDFSRLTLRWFGGEPLLALNVIRSLTVELQETCARLNIAYSASMTTNGVRLTDDVATELVSHLAVQAFEITLDGTASYHDARRNYKGGQGSFSEIFENLRSLVMRDDISPDVRLRCNVDHTNRQGFWDLLGLLVEEGMHRRLSAVYPALVFNWGNEAGDNNELNLERFAEWEMECLTHMVELGFRVNLFPVRKKITCLTLQPNAEVIDPYGSVFNCSEVSLVPKYAIGSGANGGSTRNKFSIGSLSNGVDASKRAILGDFNSKIRDGVYPCYSCRMLPVCGGGCPKQWLEGRAPCPTGKYNMPERLLLGYAASRLAESSPGEQARIG